MCRPDVNQRDFKGRTPLRSAASGGRTDVAALLLGAGALKHLPDDGGDTARRIALMRGHTELARLLL